MEEKRGMEKTQVKGKVESSSPPTVKQNSQMSTDQNLGTSLLRLVGRILDAKSNVCPTPVQAQSKNCPKIGHV